MASGRARLGSHFGPKSLETQMFYKGFCDFEGSENGKFGWRHGQKSDPLFLIFSFFEMPPCDWRHGQEMYLLFLIRFILVLVA